MSKCARCDICDCVVHNKPFSTNFRPLVKTRLCFSFDVMDGRLDICEECWEKMAAIIKNKTTGCPRCGASLEE